MWKPVLIILAIFFAFIGALFALNSSDLFSKRFGKEFSLTDSNGQTVTLETLYEKPSVVFFGYTMCPDVCPTTLIDITQWLKELGPDAEKLNVWFFTVDPERDTPEVLHDYLSNFSNNIVGVSGDPKKVHQAVKDFQIYAEKIDGKDGDYTYDHTAAIILLRPGGRIAGVIPYDADGSNSSIKTLQVMERLKRLVETAKDK